MGTPDRRPFLALGVFVALVALAAMVPASRAWLAEAILAPLRAQVEPGTGAPGYTPGSLVFWGLAGMASGWAIYEALFVRAGWRADKGFFLALAPYLLFGPLAHALVATGEWTGPLAYLGAEPPVYLTTAALATLGLGVGRGTPRPIVAAWLVALAALAPLAILAAPHLTGADVGRAAILLAVALASAAPLAYLMHRWRGEPLAVAMAVIGAHALDGATTWMVLRDPLGLGFVGYGEKNPVSLLLVDLSNGWPYFAAKLLLPIAILLALGRDVKDAWRPIVLLVVFALGFGPGMANLLQVLLGGGG